MHQDVTFQEELRIPADDGGEKSISASTGSPSRRMPEQVEKGEDDYRKFQKRESATGYADISEQSC